jgi:hypothetical protein
MEDANELIENITDPKIENLKELLLKLAED